MSDKKVERPSRNSSAEHVQPPIAKPSATSPEEANFEAPRRVDDKGKASLLERFRERDARFRGDPPSPDPADPEAATAVTEGGAEPEPEGEAAAVTEPAAAAEPAAATEPAAHAVTEGGVT